MYLLDTNVVSELRKVKTGKADARVAAWAQATPASVTDRHNRATDDRHIEATRTGL